LFLPTPFVASSDRLVQTGPVLRTNTPAPTAKLWFLFLTPHVLDGGLWPDRAIDPALEVGVIRDESMRSSANCFTGNRFPVVYPPQRPNLV